MSDLCISPDTALGHFEGRAIIRWAHDVCRDGFVLDLEGNERVFLTSWAADDMRRAGTLWVRPPPPPVTLLATFGTQVLRATEAQVVLKDPAPTPPAAPRVPLLEALAAWLFPPERLGARGGAVRRWGFGGYRLSA